MDPTSYGDFLNVNQIVAQGCSFFAQTTHGSPHLTFLKDTLSSSFVPSLIVRPFIILKHERKQKNQVFGMDYKVFVYIWYIRTGNLESMIVYLLLGIFFLSKLDFVSLPVSSGQAG